MGIIAFLLIGIVAGYLGRLLVPGKQKMGFLGTALLGMVGSLVGGTLGTLITGEAFALSAAGILGSIIGVVLVLAAMELLGKTDKGRDRVDATSR